MESSELLNRGQADAEGPGTSRRRVAVIGGGASGLVAAWLVQDRHDVVLLEAEPATGGNWHTVELDGRPVDVAASGVFGHYRHVIALAAALGVPLDPVPPPARTGLHLFLDRPLVMLPYALAITWLLPAWGLYLLLRAAGRESWLARVPMRALLVPRPLAPYLEAWLVLSAAGTTWERMRATPLLGLLAYSWGNLAPPLGGGTRTVRGGFGHLARRLRESCDRVEIRLDEALERISPGEEGGFRVETSRGAFEVDAAFLALPPWRARGLVGLDWVRDGLTHAEVVSVPVVVHATVPAPRPERLMFFLSRPFVSYRLRPEEPFRSMTATGRPAAVTDPRYTRTFETDAFKGMAELPALMARNGSGGLYLVHSAFHPSGVRNSEQAVSLAVEACRRFDPTLPGLASFARL